MPTNIRSSLCVSTVVVAVWIVLVGSVSFVSAWSSCQQASLAFTVVAPPSSLLSITLSGFLNTNHHRPHGSYGRTTATQLWMAGVDTSTSSNSNNNNNNNVSGRQLVFQGMEAFRAGQLTESIQLFDQAAAVQPSLQPFLWQRGISLYYADAFSAASHQFQNDVTVNPLDVEEIVWDIACQLRLRSQQQQQQSDDAKPFPPLRALSGLPAGKTDSRRIMGPVYRLFRGTGSEEGLAVAGHTSQK
jgi:hypothetical protein